jgi:hypothetical protein
MSEPQFRAPFTIFDSVYPTHGIGLKMGIWRDSGSAYIQCEAANTGARNICLQTYGGNVAIGTTNPLYGLDVLTEVGKAPLNVKVGTTNALSVNSSGYVGIGKTNPSVALDVNGVAGFAGGANFSGGTVSFVGATITNTLISVTIKNNANDSTAISVANTVVDNFKFTSDYATGGFSAISNVSSITIPYDGYYKVSLKFQGTAIGAVTSTFTPWILVNGSTTFIPFQMGFPGVSGFAQTLYGEYIYLMSANSTIKLQLSNSNSGTIIVAGGNITILKL